jgi:hypothetical protein
MHRSIRIALALVVSVFLGAAARAQAPAPLAVADAAKFMGAWTLTLESPQGPFSLTMTLSDVDGKVVGELASDIMGTQKVSDISKAGDDLVLKYQGDFQGQAFAAKITLTPVEDKLGVNFDVMDGQFMMSGVGTKK